MKQTSFAVLAALGLVEGVTISTTTNAYMESNRFFNGKGEPIILAETEGHARMVLEKDSVIEKFHPIEAMNLMTEECINKHAQSNSSAEVAIDDITHCPINQNGPIEAHIQQINLGDNAYVSEFYVGNPPQKVRGLFDTGSTNTWILNKNTPLKNKDGSVIEKEMSYDESASSTYKKTDQRAAIQFGSGALMGHFVTDDLRLGSCDGSKSSGQIHIKNQKFGNVEKQKTIFRGNNFEAIIGMAYPELAEAGVTPVFDEMMNQKLLKSNVFAFYFTNKNQEAAGMKSDMTFGYYDKQKFKGDITWHNVDYKYMFGVKLDDVKVGGKSLDMCSGKSCLITFDSGTSLMSFPTWGAQKLIENKLPTANNIVPCQSHSQFGDMALVINGKDYNLSNEEWMFPSQELQMAQGGVSQNLNFNMGPLGPQMMAQVSHDNIDAKFDSFNIQTPAFPFNSLVQTQKVKKHTARGPHACASTVMAMDISKEMFLVGDIFMRKFYTIFDRDQDRVGLAEAVTTSSASLAALNDIGLAQAKK